MNKVTLLKEAVSLLEELQAQVADYDRTIELLVSENKEVENKINTLSSTLPKVIRKSTKLSPSQLTSSKEREGLLVSKVVWDAHLKMCMEERVKCIDMHDRVYTLAVVKCCY